MNPSIAVQVQNLLAFLDEYAWIIDSRDGPTALAVPQGDHEVVFWIEKGNVRLFALRRDSA